MRIAKLMAGIAVAAAFVASSSQAGVVFTDNFNSENGGATALNWASFNNFGVSDGTVDIVFTGDYGLSGDDGFVDLDGSTSNGGVITTLQSFNFNAGDLVSLTFDIAGNQRGCCDANDDFFGGFIFGGSTQVNNYTLLGYWGPTLVGSYPSIAGISSSSTVGSSEPWRQYGISFRAGSSGSLQLTFGTENSNDNIGPLLDNVSLSIGAIPEPATWAMMIAGFGMTGAMLRRRRTLTA